MNKRIQTFKMGILFRLLLMSLLPVLLMGIILTIFSVNKLTKGLQDESLDGLKALAVSVSAAYAALDTGDYSLNSDGDLVKGNYNVTENIDVIDSFTEDSKMEVTIFFNDTRLATTIKDVETNERIVGTQASDAVIETVLKNKQNFTATDIIINNKNYYAFYMPLKNADGSIIGIVFAGQPSEDVNKYINTQTISVIIVALIIALLATVSSILLSKKIASGIRNAENSLKQLSEGNLNITVDDKVTSRSDEIGAMGRALNELISRLNSIIGNIKTSASVMLESGEGLDDMAIQISATTNEISSAIEGISQGAISQAEDIEVANIQISNMGDVIEEIVEYVGQLDARSIEIKSAGDESTDIINHLSDANDKTKDAIVKIGAQIHTTDESVHKIREAVTIINAIASETNLLSLNASIEAARAGEAGRGFAVVASEIQKLSEQSNDSTKKIEQIINNLTNESRKSIEVMNEVDLIVEEQHKRLDETKEKFSQVNKGINATKADISTIKNKTDICDKARKNVVEVIQNLSAISEENAASTEETNASVEEVNANINLMADSARDLKELSNKLDEDMGFFKL